MKRILVLLVVGWAWLFTPVFAESEPLSAEDFFHNGSKAYIVEGIVSAKEIVDQGLSLYPDDVSLQALKALLDRPEQEQEQEQDESGESEDSEDQESSPEDGEQDQESEDESGEDETPEEETPPEAPEPTPDDAGEEDEEEESAAAMEEMNEEEAEILLDALRQRELAEREAMIRSELQRQMQQMPPVTRDW